MNRYLYRGRRCDNGEWAVGLLAKSRADLKVPDSIVLNDWFENDMGMVIGHREKVDPTTVGHCTGLVAAKSYRGDTEADRLIFADDICESVDGRFLVAWDDKKCAFVMRFYDYPNETLYMEEMWEDTAIIGNLNDNPEVLNPAIHDEGSAE